MRVTISGCTPSAYLELIAALTISGFGAYLLLEEGAEGVQGVGR